MGPMILIREAVRVACVGVAIKDHLRQGVLASLTLRLMDWVGNARHSVALHCNYWSPAQWFRAFDTLGLRPTVLEGSTRSLPISGQFSL